MDDASSACSTHAANNTASQTALNWAMTSAPVAPAYNCGLTSYYRSNGTVASGPNYYALEKRLVCNNGSLPVNSLCTDEVPKKCTTAAGKSVTWRQFDGHSTNPKAKVPDADLPYPTTSASCVISSVPDVVSCYTVPASDGGIDFYCNYSAISTGADSPPDAPGEAGVINTPENATPGTTTVPASQTGGKCPGGTVQAGADSSGIPICIGSGTNPINSTSTGTVKTPDTTTTAADGTTTTTSTTTVTNSDHSVTTTTTTTVTSPDGTVKTSQTSTTSNTPTGTPGKGDDTKDFCSAHPELTICQNSSVAGACGQISCQGDAIQCATLRAAAAMQCAQQQDIDALKAMPQKALGDQIMAGADPMAGQIADTLKGTDVDMSRVSFDQSGFLGGGTCLANRSFTVMGHVVPVDFTSVCNNILPLRGVMMAVALILAYLIVGRSVVGS
ncbi:hypothetical protein GJ698_14380 [Pseudoduganella sp. FT26W]|uniref:TspB protein n=1 Tax=Duganella aquatilis TaxID=2666082 RepID=A0A844CZG1_9BURK|nr:virulence factor TspB C-terminal domain-related protein [Duganella aquatilis]MRW85268.1 hypothetical protein [Duganella aquatilis]